jgi:hypothetical protein
MKAHALIVLAVSLLVAADDPRPMDALTRKALSEFNLHDRNGDGFLNQDEMPDDLKAELSKWDTNRDNLVSLDEYKYYYATRMHNRRGRGKQPEAPTIIIEDEEDLDARPVVLRAGKLPIKDLPPWFMQLDTDKDGQVALYEWYQAGNDIDEFLAWDRNNDGYITPEEALYKQHLIQIANAKSGNGEPAAPALTRSSKNPTLSFGGDERGRKGRKGGGSNKSKGPQR